MKKRLSAVMSVVTALFLLIGCFTLSEASEGAPKLLTVGSKLTADGVDNIITWESEAKSIYEICVKENGEWLIAGTVYATGNKTSFTHKDQQKVQMTYTVRKVESQGEDVSESSAGAPFDEQGITSIIPVEPDVEFGNLKAIIRWKSSGDDVSYKVYRKFGGSKSWKYLGETKKHKFSDRYESTFKTSNEKKSIQNYHYVDPSENKAKYSVYAYVTKNGKKSMATRLKDGVADIQTPIISSVKGASKGYVCIKWAAVPNAEKYIILYRKKGEEHEKARVVSAEKGRIQSAKVKRKSGYSYYAVQAVYSLNGDTLKSDYEKDFTTRHRKSGKAIVLGDSVAYGTPYKTSETKGKFTFANRVGQLTGKKIANASVPGATISSKSFCLAAQAEKLYAGKYGKYGRLSGYDTVIIEAGSNDYGLSAPLGGKNSKSLSTFNGAIDRLYKSIYKADLQRVKAGKSPMKVVCVDLIFRNKKGKSAKFRNGNTFKNHKGLVLPNYQKRIDAVVKKYRKKGMKIYQINTDKLVNKSNCNMVSTDNLHMTKGIYAKIGNMISDKLY